MSNFNSILLLISFVVLSSCAAKKQVAEFDAQPEWIKQKPNIPGYYVGVGSAKKVDLPAVYMEQSRLDALADLAEEVSVQISSTSVLHTIETEYGITDYFNQQIETLSDVYLEGFEAVDSYENEDSYWVYFRISKETYKRTIAKKKAFAVENAMAEYLSGKNAEIDLNPGEAITYYLQGLLAIKPYLAEETSGDYNGIYIDVGNELYTALNKLIAGLSIIPGQQIVNVKRGATLVKPLEFSVLYDDELVMGIPVTFKFSGGYLKDNDVFSDASGRAFVDPGIVQSINETEQLTASINSSYLAQKATDDLFIRGLIANRNIDKAVTQIYISKKALTIEVDSDFCNMNDCGEIIQQFEKNARNEGYLIGATDSVDYVFKLNLKYSDGTTASNLTSTYLKGNIDIVNLEGELIWSKDIKPIKGVGTNQIIAKKTAFDELLKMLNLIYFRQGIAAID